MQYTDFKAFEEKCHGLYANLFKQLTDKSAAVMHPLEEEAFFIPTLTYLDDYKNYLNDAVDEDDLRDCLCSLGELLLFSDDGIHWKPYDEDEFDEYLDNVFDEDFYISYIDRRLTICIDDHVIDSLSAQIRSSMDHLAKADFSDFAVESIRSFVNTILPFEKISCSTFWNPTPDDGALNTLQDSNVIYALNKKEDELLEILESDNDLDDFIQAAQDYCLDMTYASPMTVQLNPFPEMDMWKMKPVFIGGMLTLIALSNVLSEFTNKSVSETANTYINFLEAKLSEAHEDINDELETAYQVIQIFITENL